MPRGQDLLTEAIQLTKDAGESATGEEQAGANELAGRMEAQHDKFFFKSLAGVPLANKAKKAATALSSDINAGNLSALDGIVSEIEDKADAPGTVLT